MKSFIDLLMILALILSVSCNKEKEIKPSDFNEFWEQTLAELNKDPIEFEKISKDSIVEGKKISLYKIKSFQDIFFYAWVSEPVNQGKFPIKIRFSGLDGNKPNRNEIKNFWFLKQEGFINMLVDVRGQGLSTEQINPKEYITKGIKNKEEYIYRGAFMDAVRSVDFISENKKSNGKIIVTGGSQGGALSIVATALNNKVSLCVINFPFLTDITAYDKTKWPMKVFLHKAKNKQIDYFDLKKTLSYFDMLNFVEMINVPVFLRTEEYDEITPKEGAIKFFNLLKDQKKVMYIEPCKGHGCSTKSIIANELEKTFIKNNLIN